MTTGNGQEWPSRDEILEAIRQGVFDAMPSPAGINEAIRRGVDDGMPYPSQILEAIGAGVEVAVKAHLSVNVPVKTGPGRKPSPMFEPHPSILESKAGQ